MIASPAPMTLSDVFVVVFHCFFFFALLPFVASSLARCQVENVVEMSGVLKSGITAKTAQFNTEYRKNTFLHDGK